MQRIVIGFFPFTREAHIQLQVTDVDGLNKICVNVAIKKHCVIFDFFFIYQTYICGIQFYENVNINNIESYFLNS